MFYSSTVSFLTLFLPNNIMAFPTISSIARERGFSKQGVPFLVWHDIIADKKERLVWFDTTVSQFEAQLQALEQVGAHPISIDSLHALLVTGKKT